MALSTILRNSVRGIRKAWTLTPSAFSDRSEVSIFLSSTVTRPRSMSDFAHTVSCDRLPQRIAARIDRSCLICSTSASSAVVNVCLIASCGIVPFMSACLTPLARDSFRFRRRVRIPGMERQVYGPECQGITVHQLDAGLHGVAASQRTVLAVQIVEPHASRAAVDDDPRVPPRHARLVQPDLAARVAADDALAVGQAERAFPGREPAG